MPITVIDKIKQKNDLDFKLLDASDINWDIDLPADKLPDTVYSKTETDSKISQAIAASQHLKRVVLGSASALPGTGEDNVIYMVPDASGEGENIYNEFMWINSKWEEIGNSKVDLTNYATKSDVSTSTANILEDAKEYADSKDTSILSQAKSYSDSQTASTLQNAKAYTDQEKVKYLPLAGGAMTGKITGIVTPTNATDAANKQYVDTVAAGVAPENMLTPQDITTGTTNGSIAVKNTDIPVRGLGTAAYTDVDDYLGSNDLNWNTIS